MALSGSRLAQLQHVGSRAGLVSHRRSGDNLMTHDNEAIIRHAYHLAEGSVLDVAGFIGSFANDGVINLGHAGIEPVGAGLESYRGEHLGDLVLRVAKYFPDIHREL